MKDLQVNNAPIAKLSFEEVRNVLRGRTDSANDTLDISLTEEPRNTNEAVDVELKVKVYPFSKRTSKFFVELIVWIVAELKFDSIQFSS